jgi:hypothetical protein
MAVESRYAALGHIGGSAQQQASEAHAKVQVQDGWRNGGAYCQREEETAAPFLRELRAAWLSYPVELILEIESKKKEEKKERERPIEES